MDYARGCCKTGDLHSCNTCHEDDSCCSSFEHCVSCCLAPANKANILAREQYRIHGESDTGYWDNAFQFCVGKCRTHKRSTEHENSFIDDRHFCFSDAARPMTGEPSEVPSNVQVVTSAKGQHCNEACANSGLVCAAGAFANINTCDHLREHFECEAGCAIGEEQLAAPAYVSFYVTKGQFPSMCFTAAEDTKPSCDKAAGALLRLCPCAQPGNTSTA